MLLLPSHQSCDSSLITRATDAFILLQPFVLCSSYLHVREPLRKVSAGSGRHLSAAGALDVAGGRGLMFVPGSSDEENHGAALLWLES